MIWERNSVVRIHYDKHSKHTCSWLKLGNFWRMSTLYSKWTCYTMGMIKPYRKFPSENTEVKKYLFLLAAYTIPLPFPQSVSTIGHPYENFKNFDLNFTPYTEIN